MRIELELAPASTPPASNHNGLVIYRGPSMLNGEPIVVVATLSSANEKTGDMIQTWILPDGDESPVDTVKHGRDESVCGDCLHGGRFWKTCYVNVGQAPLAVWRASKRGAYATFDPSNRKHRAKFKGRKARFGSYGDPVAVPVEVWHELVTLCDGHSGYTHQWRRAIARAFRTLVMASVDTAEQMHIAKRRGWKTFRVRNADELPLPGEFVCPASEEGEHKRTCEECLACRGGEYTGQATPVIVFHGSKRVDWKQRRFARMQKRMRQHKSYRMLVS